MEQPLVFDPLANKLVFLGQVATGFAKDKMYEAARSEDVFKTEVGCDGEYSRTIIRDASGTTKITLKATSPFNDVLAAAYELDVSSGGAAAGPLRIEDVNGNTACHASAAWVMGIPPIVSGKEEPEREWTLGIGRWDEFHPGGGIASATIPLSL
jgi:hypothetical protein